MSQARMRPAVAVALLLAFTVAAEAAGGPSAEITSVYTDATATYVVIRVSEPLVTGRVVHAGEAHVPLTIGELISGSAGAYVYKASTPGTDRIRYGDKVYIEPAGAPAPPMPAALPTSSPKGPEQGKVISVYTEGNTTRLVIESREALVSGRNVYVGASHIPAAVGDKLSQSGGLVYYEGVMPGKRNIKEGDPMFTDSPKRAAGSPVLLNLKLEGAYNYEEKLRAEVTAVQRGRAMFDRGTLHQVRELDLYRIYGPDGKYKGLLEVKGIGDLQSNGVLYNAFEELLLNAETGTRPGDRLVWVGQRKKLGLGLIGGMMIPNKKVFDTTELTFGTGLLWNIMFRDGWGVEVLFGGYSRTVNGTFISFFDDGCGLGTDCARLDLSSKRVAQFFAPTWVKKNFFFPRNVSPFLGAGIALFDGQHSYDKFEVHNVGGTPKHTISTEKQKKTTIVPVFGAGVEFFPARFIRPRLEVRYFKGPKISAGESTFNSESVFYSVGVFSAW